MATPTLRERYIAACVLVAEVEAAQRFDAAHTQGNPLITIEAEDPDGWLNLDEAASYAKYSKRTLTNAANKAELNSHGNGKGRRFSKSALDRWLKTKRKQK